MSHSKVFYEFSYARPLPLRHLDLLKPLLETTLVSALNPEKWNRHHHYCPQPLQQFNTETVFVFGNRVNEKSSRSSLIVAMVCLYKPEMEPIGEIDWVLLRGGCSFIVQNFSAQKFFPHSSSSHTIE